MTALRQFEVVANELPQPPYPADVRAKGWRFDLDIERIENSDTWTLTPPDMRPWLLMLWMRSWTQTPCGSLPANDELVAARIGMEARIFGANRDILMRGWYRCSDGRLYHPVITESVETMRDSRKAERLKKAKQRAGAQGEDSPPPPSPPAPAPSVTAPAPSPANVPGDRPGNPEVVPPLSQVSPTTGPGTGPGTGTGKKTSANSRPTASPDGSLFDGFWSSYPKKVAKKAARKAFDKLKPTAETMVQILAALKAQVASEEWRKEGGQYIPHPASWLNAERWTDEGVQLAAQTNAEYARNQEMLARETQRGQTLKVDPNLIAAAKATAQAARVRALGAPMGPRPISSLFPAQEDEPA